MAENSKTKIQDADIAKEGFTYRSGNPGYDDGLPLLVSQGLTSANTEKLDLTGFKIFSSDKNGECLTGDISNTYSQYLTLGFNEGVVVSCK